MRLKSRLRCCRGDLENFKLMVRLGHESGVSATAFVSHSRGYGLVRLSR